MIDYDKILKKAESLGASDAEAVILKQSTTYVSTTKGFVYKLKVGETVKLGLRVSMGKRSAGISAAVTPNTDIDTLVEKTVEIARNSPEDPDWPGVAKGLSKANVKGIFDEKLANLPIEEAINIAVESAKLVNDFHKYTYSMSSGIRVYLTEVTIANSYGEEVSSKASSTFFSIIAGANDGTKNGSYGEYKIFRRLADLNYEDISKLVAQRALDSLEAKQIPTGHYDIIFEGRIFSLLLETLFAQAVSAYNVQIGRSPLKGKIGEKIAGNNISFLEDPHMPWFPGTKEFDDEGIPTKRFYVVEKGVLKSYLYDYYTAKREGKESTGNASRGLGQRGIPMPNNVILVPGDASEEEIIEETKRGVIVSNSIGYWLSNYISGQMNGTISHGYIVENGEIKHAVKGVAFSDNFYDVLKGKLDMIAKELKPAMRMASPMVRVKDSTIAGL
ncbi:MAG TPA: TldD/PmbA family protein [Euryarchaeota archaeon]|nr:TldD/PmbA family protein [Euryarchaeota archaeon]